MDENKEQVKPVSPEPLMVPPWKLKQRSVYENDAPNSLNESKSSKKKWVLITILLLLTTNAVTAGFFINQIQKTYSGTYLSTDENNSDTQSSPLIPGIPQNFLNISGPLAQANDTERRSHLAAIGTALSVYASEDGRMENFPTEEICIGKSEGCFNLEEILVPQYLSEIPKDPTIGTDVNSGYTFYLDAADYFVLGAVGESEPVIIIRK
jgi:hypothetical protein